MEKSINIRCFARNDAQKQCQKRSSPLLARSYCRWTFLDFYDSSGLYLDSEFFGKRLDRVDNIE